MKKLTLILICSICFFELFSQNWAPIGTKWYYNQGTINPNLQIYKIIESTGDTIFQNKNCRILKETINLPPFSFNTFFMYSSNDSVYYYDYSFNNFCLLYFFNAQQGDTVHLDCYDLNCIIDSVKIINYNGHDRKVQFLTTYSMGYNMFDRNIEGIGNSIFMLPVGDNYMTGPLRCFEDSYGLIKFSPLECDTVINTEINKNEFIEDIKIFTDELNTKIIIELPESNSEIQVINFYSGIGQKIMNLKNSNKKHIEISIDKLSTGIYFIELINNQNQRVIKKILI